MKRIYLDHSATTPVDQRVIDAMLPYFSEEFGNPSSIHSHGRKAKVALEEAREKVAKVMQASAGEIVFTAGGTEADNLAIFGVAQSPNVRGKHVITSGTEHHAVVHSFEMLQKNGFTVTIVACDQYGMILPDVIEKAIRPDTVLISIIHANNEVGTINPVNEIGTIARQRGILFHTDAVQSFGKIPMDVNTMSIDLLSTSAHKIYGPKGVGALYVRRGVKLQPQIYGGSQERDQRAGTENIAGIVGFGKAAELCADGMVSESHRLSALHVKLWGAIHASIPNTVLNGHPEKRLPGHLNISFKGFMGDEILMLLDLSGIAVSTGSACTSGAVSSSHVLTAMKLDDATRGGAIRLTLGRSSKEEDIPYIVETLQNCVMKMKA
jgi:cysteine desulfurase